MAKGKNPPRHRKQNHAPQQPAAPVYGSQNFRMAEELLNEHQGMVNTLLSGRKDTGFKVKDLWNGWYNNLMAICFTLGGALIAISPALTSKSTLNKNLFWLGNALLITDGIYILVKRKLAFERENTDLITLGYEEEYWALVLKNCYLEYLLTGSFNLQRHNEANDKLYDIATAGLKKAQEQTSGIDYSMDVMTSLLIIGIFCFVLSSIINWITEIAVTIIGGAAIIWMLYKFRASAGPPQAALAKRKSWEEKIAVERDRFRKKN